MRDQHRLCRLSPLLALLLAIALLWSGCTLRTEAVILWPDNDLPLASGDVVTVSQRHDADDEVTIVAASGDRYRMRAWQVAEFSSEEELQEFLSAYQEYRYLFAQCQKRALPIRSEADRFSDLLYRLDQGEIIKIIDRLDEISDEAGLMDYWYRVLTSSGQEGWVFGYHLALIDIQENTVADSREAQDNLALFLNNIWRPAYFTTMKENNSYDLDRFQAIFGLFPAPLEKRIQIALPDYEISIDYDIPLPESARVFYFGDQNRLKITLENRERIVAEIRSEGATERFDFHLLEDVIQQIVTTTRANLRVNDIN